MENEVFVTGGGGFVGKAVLRQLHQRGIPAVALVHRRPIELPGMRSASADLFNPEALAQAMRGCAAVIHLIGIIAEKPKEGVTFQRMHVDATAAVVQAAKSVGVRRYVHMSALGARSDAVATYHHTKYEAEQLVRQSGLDWTIFRPSMIHGPEGEFMKMEKRWALKKAPPFLFMPYFGRGVFGAGGAGRMQPVYVEDVARAFVDALTKPQTCGHAFDLAGPDVFTWPRFHRACAEIFTGHRRWVMPLPAWYAKLLTHIAPASLLPFNWDQVVMSQEDNTADVREVEKTFGWRSQPLEPTLRAYADYM